MRTFKLLLLAVSLALSFPSISQPKQESDKPQRVIIFMLDGFGVDYYRSCPMPTLNRMEKTGIFKDAKSLMPTVTNTNNASISTGVFPNVHGITGNSFFNLNTGQEEYMEDSSLLLAPTVFERAKKLGVQSMMFSSKKKSISLLSRGAVLALSPETAGAEWIQQLGKPPDIYSREVNYWLMEAALYNIRKHPEIGCFYIHTTDFPMHTWAPENEMSKEHLRHLDGYISEVIKAAPDAAILITADHSVHHKSFCWDLAKACAKGGAPIRMAISAERDKYPRHHRGFGGTSYVYLNHPEEFQKVREILTGLKGVEKILSREEAVTIYHLKADRIGDLVVFGDKDTVFGDLDAEFENLPEEYRSHGSEYESSVPLFIYNARNAPSLEYLIYNFNLTSWLFKTEKE
jgi:phosphonoacetate hydrolase